MLSNWKLDSRGVFLIYKYKKKEEGRHYEWNSNDDNSHCSVGGAYLLYGRYLQNKWGIDPKAKTPAYEMEDGVDYVPADTNVVLVISLHL